MIDLLKTIFAAPDAPRAEVPPDRAVAALLVEAARSDGDYDPAEMAAIDRFLGEIFETSQDAARALRVEGEGAQAEAVDLHRFTRVVKTGLDAEKRATILEALWFVALADGERDPHENALIRKLAPLLALTDHDSAAARRRAMARVSDG